MWMSGKFLELFLEDLLFATLPHRARIFCRNPARAATNSLSVRGFFVDQRPGGLQVQLLFHRGSSSGLREQGNAAPAITAPYLTTTGAGPGTRPDLGKFP